LVHENDHISRFSLSSEVILAISLGKFRNAEEVDLSFNSEMKPPGVFFVEKDAVKMFFDQIF